MTPAQCGGSYTLADWTTVTHFVSLHCTPSNFVDCLFYYLLFGLSTRSFDHNVVIDLTWIELHQCRLF